MKTLSRILTLVISLSLILAACASPTAAPTQAPAPAEPTAPPAEAPAATEAIAAKEAPAAPEEPAATEEPAAPAITEPITIEFWTMLGGDLGERVKKLVEEYNNSQDMVTIMEVNQGDYEPLLQKQLAAVVAGNFPPVTLIDYKTVPFFAQAGVLEPIANWASQEDMDDFLPGLLTDLTYEGVVYALPFNRSYQGVYYNKDLFRQAGLDPEAPPKTWDEYAAVTDAIDALGDDIYGTYIYRRSHEFLLSFGEPISNENCDVTVASDAGVAAYQYLQDLHFVHNALVPANLSGPFDQAAIEFIQGKVGMYSGSIAIQNRVGSTVEFDWGFFLMPAGPGGFAWLGGGGNVALSASATPEQKAAAWDFARWLTSKEKSAEWHMGTGYLPTRKSVAELPEVQAFYAENPSWKTSVEGVQYIYKTPCAIVNIPQYVSIVTPATDRVVLNQEDPRTVLQELQLELQDLIDQARENGELIILK